jgi:hypothetical protein
VQQQQQRRQRQDVRVHAYIAQDYLHQPRGEIFVRVNVSVYVRIANRYVAWKKMKKQGHN